MAQAATIATIGYGRRFTGSVALRESGSVTGRWGAAGGIDSGA